MCGLLSYAESEALVNSRNDAEWAEILDLIGEWQKVRFKTSSLSGGRIGLKTDPKEKRLLIRNEARRVLGLLPVSEDESQSFATTEYLCSTPCCSAYPGCSCSVREIC